MLDRWHRYVVIVISKSKLMDISEFDDWCYFRQNKFSRSLVNVGMRREREHRQNIFQV